MQPQTPSHSCLTERRTSKSTLAAVGNVSFNMIYVIPQRINEQRLRNNDMESLICKHGSKIHGNENEKQK